MTGASRRMFDTLDASLKDMRVELGSAPWAILMVSGHWEEPSFALSSSALPGMIYDYQGFPAENYTLRYPAPGSPELARTASALLEAAGFPAFLYGRRGYDHGTFSVMQALYPEATMPVVQLSLRRDFDAAAHLAAGRALSPLRDMGVLIIGSGLSYHNLGEMRGTRGHAPSRRFDAWLQQTLVSGPVADRAGKLMAWETAPAAREAHPDEDHLLPLMVAVGAAGDDPGTLTYHQTDFAGGLTASSFRFGNTPVVGG
jgi:aromatic ring-opening dioxygenase catalytic subunit (LigB family)